MPSQEEGGHVDWIVVDDVCDNLSNGNESATRAFHYLKGGERLTKSSHRLSAPDAIIRGVLAGCDARQ